MTIIDQASALRSMVNQRPRATVLAVTSGKGGVGKSNIAVNLATHFAASGKEVVLFDADLGLANADVLCGIDLPFNLSHVIARKKSLREVMVKTEMGFKLIGGASGLAKMADLTEQDRRAIVSSLETLEYQADIILIDTGAGISSNVLCFARAADDVVVVTTPEPTAITDAYAMVKVLSRDTLEMPRMNLLVNQVRYPSEARLVYDRIARVARQFLNVTVYDAGYIFHDENVSQAVRKRKPFVINAPRCPASMCLTQLAGRLQEGLSPAPPQGGFFRKMGRWLWG